MDIRQAIEKLEPDNFQKKKMLEIILSENPHNSRLRKGIIRPSLGIALSMIIVIIGATAFNILKKNPDFTGIYTSSGGADFTSELAQSPELFAEPEITTTDITSDEHNSSENQSTFSEKEEKWRSINFGLPIESYYVSEEYGGESHFHYGMDLAAEGGTAIYAAADGIVSEDEYEGDGFWYYDYGKCVIINHADGIKTFYAHCSEILVEKGETVKKGDLIARVGDSGMVTGNILHFEVRVDGIAYNPREVIDFEVSAN